MNFSEKDFISPDEILSDVMSFTGEERLEGVTRGFIYSQMNKCLESLSYHTFFNEETKTFDMPASRIIDVPAMVFNIREMYGYNGTDCTIANSTNIYWKRNYYHNGGDSVSRNKEDNHNDPFYSTTGFDRRINNSAPNDAFEDGYGRTSNRLFYYGFQQGQLFFSPNSAMFSNILIKFNGIWKLDKNTPSIPRYFRQVITDWCVERVFRKKKVDNLQKYRILWSDAKIDLRGNGFSGSWYEAEQIVKRQGSKEREDLNEYLSRLNY